MNFNEVKKLLFRELNIDPYYPGWKMVNPTQFNLIVNNVKQQDKYFHLYIRIKEEDTIEWYLELWDKETSPIHLSIFTTYRCNDLPKHILKIYLNKYQLELAALGLLKSYNEVRCQKVNEFKTRIAEAKKALHLLSTEFEETLMSYIIEDRKAESEPSYVVNNQGKLVFYISDIPQSIILD